MPPTDEPPPIVNSDDEDGNGRTDDNDDNDNDVDMTESALPVWRAEGPQATVYHASTKLSDGRIGILLDTGAVGNLCGEQWAVAITAAAARTRLIDRDGKEVRAYGNNLAAPKTFKGVGNGVQECRLEIDAPAAITRTDGAMELRRYVAPIIPGSDLPALWGMSSLKAQGAIIDCRNNRLWLCGPGDVEVVPPPGSICLNLSEAETGHLLLPISEFAKYKEWQRCHPHWDQQLGPATTNTLTTNTAAAPPSSPSSPSSPPSP